MAVGERAAETKELSHRVHQLTRGEAGLAPDQVHPQGRTPAARARFRLGEGGLERPPADLGELEGGLSIAGGGGGGQIGLGGAPTGTRLELCPAPTRGPGRRAWRGSLARGLRDGNHAG
ncbi:MAG: hypothetical protein R3F43_11255 [bacterium]